MAASVRYNAKSEQAASPPRNLASISKPSPVLVLTHYVPTLNMTVHVLAQDIHKRGWVNKILRLLSI